VTVERAFGALKNRFRILDNKPFYPYKTQVKLVLACCILHNWILRHRDDDYIPMKPPGLATPMTMLHSQIMFQIMGHGQREAWATQMWQNRGSSRV
jgi:hypothetical protein